MNESEKVYRDLQKHLDKQVVGFPATKSGSEIRILKRLFTPEEASLAMHLSYQPCSAREFFDIVKPEGMSLADVEKLLDGMRAKGAIGRIIKENARYYFTWPLVVGMYEWQLERLTPEFLDDISKYCSDRNFGLAFLGTRLPQMRTIPVEKSLRVEHHVTTYDNVREIINGTDDPIGIVECICRKGAKIKGRPCRKTSRLETCMCFGEWAIEGIRQGVARAISKDEALEIMRQSEEDGLVLQPSNDKKIEFICACCGCCCGMLTVLKTLPKPVDFWATNYYAVVNAESCNGCGTCVERCQMNAARIDEKTGVAGVNPDRCLGCGLCVTSCPSEAINLVRKEKETVPPEDLESLNKIIAENKPGTLDKIKLIGRMVLKK